MNPKERSGLRARAHALNPVVIVGGEGLTPAVVAEIDRALKAHELIKVRIAEAGREDRESLMDSICAETGAEPVQHIGKILVVFRERPRDEPRQPAPPARKASQRRKAPVRKAKRPAAAPRAARRGAGRAGRAR